MPQLLLPMAAPRVAGMPCAFNPGNVVVREGEGAVEER